MQGILLQLRKLFMNLGWGPRAKVDPTDFAQSLSLNCAVQQVRCPVLLSEPLLPAMYGCYIYLLEPLLPVICRCGVYTATSFAIIDSPSYW